jgi:hypothetical protein
MTRPKEYISKRRRYALRDAIGALMAEHERAIKYTFLGKADRERKARQRFYAAAERLIDLHRGIPDE